MAVPGANFGGKRVGSNGLKQGIIIMNNICDCAFGIQFSKSSTMASGYTNKPEISSI